MKLDTTNLTVQTLVENCFSVKFIALVVEQTNSCTAKEIAEHEEIK